ncbi:MAG: DUF6600 domain-containing protein [Acidobacteriota bacterium]
MKIAPIALVLLVLAIPATADIPFASSIHPNPAGGADVDLGFFFDSLSPYGNWVQTPAYGWAFVPDVATTTWRPYTDGQWLYTDAGWTWLSEEPFGWATYHYGRWDLNPDYGWMWVPGDQWAPAWVDWRATDDSIGWAPLPPSYTVRRNLAWPRMDVDLPAEAYVFVPETRFLQPGVMAFALPPGQIPGLFRSSRRFTQFRFANDRIIDEGLPFVTVQRRIGRRIPRYQLVDLAPRFWGSRPRARVAGNRLEIFRPRVLRTAVAVPPARPIASRSVMRVHDAVRVRKLARARAAAFNLPPPRAVAVSRRDFGQSRRVGPPDTRQVVVGRDFGKTRGIGGIGQETHVTRSRRAFDRSHGIEKGVRRQQLSPRRGTRLDQGRKAEIRRQDVRTSRGRPEVRRSSRGAPPPRLKVERHRSSRPTRISPGGPKRTRVGAARKRR